jgi:hypothetical protein
LAHTRTQEIMDPTSPDFPFLLDKRTFKSP